jgi:hypothetical protein
MSICRLDKKVKNLKPIMATCRTLSIPNNKGRKVFVVGSSNIFLNRYILPSNYILPSMPPVGKKTLHQTIYYPQYHR